MFCLLIKYEEVDVLTKLTEVSGAENGDQVCFLSWNRSFANKTLRMNRRVGRYTSCIKHFGYISPKKIIRWLISI